MLTAFLGVLVGPASAEVTLPPIFSKHAVLQKSEHTPIWGKSAPEEDISIEIGGSKATARANAEGKWRADLDLSRSGPGPFELVVKGRNTVVVPDVVVGEVWLCSGQSNMEFPLSATTGAAEEAAHSSNPGLREFQVDKVASATPLDECKGRWTVAGPETSPRFSAVGYYFGKRLASELGQPVGLINSSWGGTPIEAWISKSGFAKDPELGPRSDAILKDQEGYASRFEDFKQRYQAWAAENKREDRPAQDGKSFAAADISTEDWKPVMLPGLLAPQGLPDSGVTWLRRTVTVPSSLVGPLFPLFLGTLNDFDSVYWNGQKIGFTTSTHTTSVNSTIAGTTDRRYDVPSSLMKAGDNVLAIRLFSPAGNAGVISPYLNAAWILPLGGKWLAKTEYELSPLTPAATSAYPKRPSVPPLPQYNPSALFNAMISPLVPYGIRGILWYQGESNVDRAFQYRTALKLLISDWREHWQQDELPFNLAQIANFLAKSRFPEESHSAELREAQAMALSLPKTGMAVLIDLGEQDDIHFRNKKDVGDRLALISLNRSYGKSVPYSGPVYEKVQLEDGLMRIHFTSADGGLVARPLPENYQPQSTVPKTVPLVRNSPGSELEGFAICGEDRKWKWAEAKIEGSTVLVWSDEVPHPVAVRYAWGSNPTCNLYNGAGLPATPFRTDDFPLLSQGKRY